jgi:putative translation factor pelota
MKAEFGDIRENYGEIRLLPETIDDLWHLKHLVLPGSLVFATTFRSVEGATDKLRPEKVEKRPVRLGVRAEKIEFSEHGIRLRITGIIEHGIDCGAYHTINVETGYEISVIRQWRPVDLERIERAKKSSVFGVIHVLTLEEGEAELFRIRQYGPESVVTVTTGSGKGGECDNRVAFFDAVIKTISEITGPLVIAGPGFIKDDFLRYAKNRNCPPAERAVVTETRRIGRGAVQDVIGAGTLEKMIGDLQLSREVRLMDEVLLRIAQEGAVAYGRKQVADAIDYGAVEEVLIADTLLHDAATAPLLERAERMQSRVVVLSTEFEPGERLVALGGIAALLRYKM